ncbi:MAG: hypothetical protein JWP19_2217 [Rhodoglobus sp.]|nr:hypothetical protein [Rhodoglobus sp.]
MTSRYEVLATLVDTAAGSHGTDDLGYHHALVGILRELHVAEQSGASRAQLADAIYDRIADSEISQQWDANGDNSPA